MPWSTNVQAYAAPLAIRPESQGPLSPVAVWSSSLFNEHAGDLSRHPVGDYAARATVGSPGFPGERNHPAIAAYPLVARELMHPRVAGDRSP